MRRLLLIAALLALALGSAHAQTMNGGSSGGVNVSTPNAWSAGQRGPWVSVPSGATVNWDLKAGNNQTLTFTTNGQLANPTNIAVAGGQTGIFIINQDATGTRQITFDTDYVFPDNQTPVLQIAPFAQDVFYYVVIDATHILFSIVPADTLYALKDRVNVFTKGQSVTPTALVDAATVTPDFSTSNYFTWTISQNTATLANPTNIAAGRCGMLKIKQDGTGSRNISVWGSFWLFSLGVKPTLTASPNATDALAFCAISTTEVVTSFIQNYQ